MTHIITYIVRLEFRKLAQECSTNLRFRDQYNFRKWPETSGKFREILNSNNRRLHFFIAELERKE